MIIEIISKLVAESLLSLYPTFVKNINLAIGIQLWSRCFAYTIISAIFIDWTFIGKHIFSQNGLLLAFITAVHIYTSYRGFQLLNGGIAYALFYTYPIMILLLSGEKIQFNTVIALIVVMIGVMIIYFSDKIDIWLSRSTEESNESNDSTILVNTIDSPSWIGYIMIFFAALSEALIYFLVREIKTPNNWNHLFLSYLLGAIFLSGYYFQDILNISPMSQLSLSLVINIFIGLFGYLLRFYAISRLKPSIYAPLSYFGIVMAFIYGIIFNGEIVSFTKITGVVCILLGMYLL